MDYTYFQNDKGNFVAKKLPTAKGNFLTIKDESCLDELRYDLKEHKPNTLAEFEKIYKEHFQDDYGYDLEFISFEEAIEQNKKNWLGDKKWIQTYWGELTDIVNDLDCGNIQIDLAWQLVPDYEVEEILTTNMFVISRELSAEQWRFVFKGKRLSELKEIARRLNLDASLIKEQLIDILTEIAIEDPLKIDESSTSVHFLIKPRIELQESLKWLLSSMLMTLN